jgi:hypothetical protein
VSQPVLECPAEWVNDCGCSSSHNYCWPRPDTGCCERLNVDPVTDPDQAAVVERTLRIAVSILHGLTARQFGLCPVTVRPCRDTCVQDVPPGSAWMTPDVVDGKWINIACGACKSSCSCSAVCELALPGRVESIDSVVVDGVVVPPTSYRVDNHKYLVRQGDGCWPTCQDLGEPIGMPGTWSVTYRRGTPVPEAGLWAAGLLACELVKACTPGQSGACDLPANIKSVTREGVAIDFEAVNVAVIGNQGRTGIPEVDLWIQTVNPYGVTGRARAYSPDRPPMRSTTWPCP